MTGSTPGAPRWTVPGYTAVRELGSGASGPVVLARDDGTGTLVAIRFLANAPHRDPEFLARVREEARLLGGIGAPNVVRLREYLEGPGGAAIVTDLVDGVSLRRILDDGPTDPEAALWVLRGSLLGLGAAHARGVVHRAYGPANVLVTAAGTGVVTDFGLGVGVEACGRWSGGPATDIHAAAATFVECLTGRPPCPVTDHGLRHRRRQQAPADGVPGPVRGLVVGALAEDPAARPADTATFLAQLYEAARAGYGDDWEERGRRELARRVTRLRPSPAADPAGGTGREQVTTRR